MINQNFKLILSTAICLVLLNSLSAQNPKNKIQTPDKFSFTGFYNTTDIGILMGASRNTQKAPLSFMSVTGYQMNEKLAVGIGLGVDLLEESYIPLVADIRYYFRDTNFSPFIFVQGGYSIALEDKVSLNIYNDFSGIWSMPYIDRTHVKVKGGYLINPGFGVRKMFGKNFGIVFTASYRHQKLSYEATEDNKLFLEYNRLNLRIGIIFR